MSPKNSHPSRSLSRTISASLDPYESIQGCWVSPHTSRYCRWKVKLPSATVSPIKPSFHLPVARQGDSFFGICICIYIRISHSAGLMSYQTFFRVEPLSETISSSASTGVDCNLCFARFLLRGWSQACACCSPMRPGPWHYVSLRRTSTIKVPPSVAFFFGLSSRLLLNQFRNLTFPFLRPDLMTPATQGAGTLDWRAT